MKKEIIIIEVFDSLKIITDELSRMERRSGVWKVEGKSALAVLN